MATEESISAAFPFKSNYVDVLGSRMHYVDEGSGDPILFLHGNPTSSYLWRNIIPHVTPMGRAIAPDLIGMGKSDKPDIEYRLVDHVKYVDGFIEALGLKNITFVIHDWGSSLGFHYVMRHESNVKGLAFMEAILFERHWDSMSERSKRLFGSLRTPGSGWDMIMNDNFFVERVLPGSVVRKLTDEEMERYREPFREPPARLPTWRWPNEIPIEGEPADVVTMVMAYREWLQRTALPKLLFYATPGAIIDAEQVAWCETNLKNLTTVDLGEGIHFVQEDHPHLIGAKLAEWYQGL